MNISQNYYVIEYTNHFEYEGNLYAFRKRELFCITNTPVWIKYNTTARCWVNGKSKMTKTLIESLIINKPIRVDVTSLNWDLQCRLDGVFYLAL
jgi:hypothetical protein